jgi:hypothetical protein
MTSKDDEMVGKIKRGDLFREVLYLRGLIRSAIECTDNGGNNGLIPDNGLYEVLAVSERLADDLSEKVSP